MKWRNKEILSQKVLVDHPNKWLNGKVELTLSDLGVFVTEIVDADELADALKEQAQPAPVEAVTEQSAPVPPSEPTVSAPESLVVSSSTSVSEEALAQTSPAPETVTTPSS